VAVGKLFRHPDFSAMFWAQGVVEGYLGDGVVIKNFRVQVWLLHSANIAFFVESMVAFLMN
jgi:hypothetical protein